MAREDDGETENARVQRRGRLGGAGCQGRRREGTRPSATARGLEQLHDPFRIEGRRGRPRALGEEAEELEIEAPDLKLGKRMDREEEEGGCWDFGGAGNQGRILDREEEASGAGWMEMDREGSRGGRELVAAAEGIWWMGQGS